MFHRIGYYSMNKASGLKEKKKTLATTQPKIYFVPIDWFQLKSDQRHLLYESVPPFCKREGSSIKDDAIYSYVSRSLMPPQWLSLTKIIMSKWLQMDVPLNA